MKKSDFPRKFSIKGKAFGSQLLFNRKDSVELIWYLTKRGYHLEGVEGFRQTPLGAYQPTQEYSNDFVDFDCNQCEFIRATIDMIENAGFSELYFDVVLTKK